MTERRLDLSPLPPHDPSPEDAFAAAVVEKVNTEGRKWAWLAREVELSPNTLRSQIIDDPGRLRLRTARRLSTVLNIPLWGEAA